MSNRTSKPMIVVGASRTTGFDTGRQRDLPTEVRCLRPIMEQAERDGLCAFTERISLEAEDVQDVFENVEYGSRISVFHFAGHPQSFDALNSSMRGDVDLPAFLGQHTALQLLFLNGCADPATAHSLCNYVPVVISASQHITDQAALSFAERFYKGMVNGSSIGSAFAQAEAAIRVETGTDWQRLYESDNATDLLAEQWPWQMHVRPGAEAVLDWNLADVSQNPLFGLPKLPQLPLPDEPFRNLHWFKREHAQIFFGRGEEIRRLYEQLTSAQGAPILLLYGKAGVGKSSLLDAGILPRMERSHIARYQRRSQTEGIEASLQLLLKHDDEQNTETEPRDQWMHLERIAQKPLVAILDQVEEIFTRPLQNPQNEIDELVSWLRSVFASKLMRPQGKIVLGFRQEWLAEIEQMLKENSLHYAKLCLDDLSRHKIIEAVTGITQSATTQHAYHLSIEDDLPVAIADDLLADRDSVVAPTLQILLTKLWSVAKEENRDAPMFTLNAYQALKREGILLDDFLSQQLANLREHYPMAVDSGLVYDILQAHTTPMGAARQCGFSELLSLYAHETSDLWALLSACCERYLLMRVEPQRLGHERDSGEAISATRLAHDTLAPLIRKRFDQSDLPGQRARRILESFVREWRLQTHGPLLDSQSLKVIEQGRAGMRILTPDEEALVEKSQQAVGPLVLSPELFPADLDVRHFVPEALLEINVGPYNNLLGKSIGVAFNVVGTASAVMGGFNQGRHIVQGAKSVQTSVKGEYLSFNFHTKEVKLVSEEEEVKSSIVRLNIFHKRDAHIGQLLVDDYVFYETRPMPSQEAVEDWVVPFWRALNHGMGFSTAIQYFKEEEEEKGLLDLYETKDAAAASLAATKQKIATVEDVYKPSGKVPWAGKLGLLFVTPVALVLTMVLGVLPTLGYRWLINAIAPMGLPTGRVGMQAGLVMAIVVLVVLGVTAALLVVVPTFCLAGVGKLTKCRNAFWPTLLALLTVLPACVVLFWPGLLLIGTTLAPTGLTFLFIPVKWPLILIGLIGVPLVTASATYGAVRGRKFCEKSNVFLKPMRTVFFPLKDLPQVEQALDASDFVTLRRLMIDANQGHTTRVQLWWHPKAETAYLQMDASFRGKYYKIDNKEGKQEAKYVQEEWLVRSQELTSSDAQRFLEELK